MKVIFKNSDEPIELNGYSISEDIITLMYDNPKENLSGFSLYENDGKTLVRNCDDFVYRWDTSYHVEGQITYTNSENNTQPDTDPDSTVEYISPITNEELTSCVGDLLYETSLMKLGMEVE